MVTPLNLACAPSYFVLNLVEDHQSFARLDFLISHNPKQVNNPPQILILLKDGRELIFLIKVPGRFSSR
jgi:hypothetical protein